MSADSERPIPAHSRETGPTPRRPASPEARDLPGTVSPERASATHSGWAAAAAAGSSSVSGTDPSPVNGRVPVVSASLGVRGSISLSSGAPRAPFQRPDLHGESYGKVNGVATGWPVRKGFVAPRRNSRNHAFRLPAGTDRAGAAAQERRAAHRRAAALRALPPHAAGRRARLPLRGGDRLRAVPAAPPQRPGAKRARALAGAQAGRPRPSAQRPVELRGPWTPSSSPSRSTALARRSSSTSRTSRTIRNSPTTT